MIREGVVGVIVVAKLDRLGRSMRHLSVLLGELDDRGVRLVSVAEAFDSATASGRLQRNILGSFAEFEREQIRERTSSGVAAVAREGFWPGGPPPFGWAVAPDPGQPHRARLVVADHEAEALRVAVDAVVNENLSTGEVATRLNQGGFRPRKAARWHGHMLRHLLLNLPLSGQWVWRRGQDRSGRRRRSEGAPIMVAVPPLIDGPTHERLLAILADRSTGARASMRQRDYLLSRRITSPHGSAMVGIPRANHERRYVCRDSIGTASSPDSCGCHRVDADGVEEAVWAEIVAVISEPERLMALAEAALGARAGEREVEEGQMGALDRRIRRLEEALAEDLVGLVARGVDHAAVRRATAKLDRELAELRRRRVQLAGWRSANQLTAQRAQKLQELVAEASVALERTDFAGRRRLVDLLDVQVRVNGWEPCHTCGGRGLLPAPEIQSSTERRRTPLVCPTCHRRRWLPRITISGLLPFAEEDAEPPEELPFEVELERTADG